MTILGKFKAWRKILYIAGQLIQAGLSALIRIYQFAISSLLGHCCRFEPTCSSYALQAIKVHGCLKGCYLSSRRILRCHPWHAGGLDPVPQPKSANK